MSAALALAAAVLPGMLTWAWGRALVRATGDPTLPERVLAWRHRSALAVATGAAVLIVLLPRQAPWALPLLVLVRLMGGFPARRALFDEGWDLVSYLAWLARLTVGVGGFWGLLMLAPALVSWSGALAWPVAAALAAILAAWGLAYPRVLLAVMGGAPLSRPDLEARFESIAARSTAPMPRLWRVGHPEGRTANAFALPSTGRPSVVFTQTLLHLFDGDELAAVFAHEQAHLEHFDSRRVTRLAVVQTVAVLLGTLGAAAALERLAGSHWVIVLGWPLIVLVAALARLVRHKAHETASDLRAVELCGDGPALARALVKLHALALLPRRLAVEDEGRATHPSLAHRLRAIEAASAPSEPTADEPREEPGRPSPTILAGAEPGSWVLLEARHGHWLDGVPEGTPRESGALRAAASRARSYAWSELVDLRLKPRGTGHELLASDRSGSTWSQPLAPGEGPAAHAALDTLDQRLAPASTARDERKLLGVLVACAGAVAALAVWSAALVPALLALALPQPGPLAAFGVTALVGAGLAWAAGHAVSDAVFAPGTGAVAAVGLAVFGAAALWIARTTAWRETARRTRSAPWVGLVLALCGLAGLVPTVIGLVSGGALRVHIAARDHPGGAVLLLGAAAAVLVGRRRGSRGLAAALGLVAAVALTLGSPAFARRFVHDPFFPPAVPAVARDVTLVPVDERTVPASSGTLELSPSGASWAVHYTGVGRGRETPVQRIVVGSGDGREHRYEASAIFLLDDDRLLAFFNESEEAALELRPHDPSAPAQWRVELEPLLASAELAVQRSTGRWRVGGTHPETGDFVRTTGGLDGAFSVERWSPGGEAAAWVAGDGPSVLGIASRLDGADLTDEWDEDSPSFSWLLAAPWGVLPGSRVVSLDAGGAHELYLSQLFAQCDPAPPGRTRPLCRTHDGSRTALWRIDPAEGGREVLAVLDGYAWPAVPWKTDWLVLSSAGSTQQLHLVGDGPPTRLDTGHETPWVQTVAGFDSGVGVLVSDGPRRSRLLLYRLP